MAVDIFLYLLSFVFIWFGAGLIVSSVDAFARKLRISSFALSFFVLGILTSLPEISVGINSILRNETELERIRRYIASNPSRWQVRMDGISDRNPG